MKKNIKETKEKILSALADEKDFELVFTCETTYSINVKARNEEEARKMFENGKLTWDGNDITDEDYIQGSLEVIGKD